MAAQVDSNRPRSKSMLSFGGSHRSRKSTGSITKIDLTETPKEKSSRRMTSKADPTLAIHEAQPGTRYIHLVYLAIYALKGSMADFDTNSGSSMGKSYNRIYPVDSAPGCTWQYYQYVLSANSDGKRTQLTRLS